MGTTRGVPSFQVYASRAGTAEWSNSWAIEWSSNDRSPCFDGMSRSFMSLKSFQKTCLCYNGDTGEPADRNTICAEMEYIPAESVHENHHKNNKRSAFPGVFSLCNLCPYYCCGATKYKRGGHSGYHRHRTEADWQI